MLNYLAMSFNFAFKFGTKYKLCFRYKGFTGFINRGFRIILDGKLHKYIICQICSFDQILQYNVVIIPHGVYFMWVGKANIKMGREVTV